REPGRFLSYSFSSSASSSSSFSNMQEGRGRRREGARGRLRFAQVLLFGLAVFGMQTAPAQELFTDKSDIAVTEVDRMYVKGLQHLVRTQAADGRWSDGPYGGEPAVIGLAVISMLAHGDDPNLGPYSLSVRRGLDFI